jgi:hypothetical protein
MKSIPELTAKAISYFKQAPTEGLLKNAYVPFRNKLTSGEGSKANSIVDFTTNELEYGPEHPLTMSVQDSYDGSVNLIINDDAHTPKMVNSRFSVHENGTYVIADHRGNRDTNLYKEGQMEQDTKLYKTIDRIVKLRFDGVQDGGKLPVGSYYFYFKLSDNDDNETDFILESSVVTCHIGRSSQPRSIRMGMENENSEKSVKFTLTNVDTSFDYVKVYYTRVTSSNDGLDTTSAHYVQEKYPINGSTVSVIITGYEDIQDVALEDINPSFQYCQCVKTQAQCQNMLFFGNIYKPELNYELFEKFGQMITPEVVQEYSIGGLDDRYSGGALSDKWGREYYNANNLYYRLGYFPTEYYRFGIVYILKDFTLSPVFNVRGGNLERRPENTSWTSFEKLSCDENGMVTGSLWQENVRGVVKLPNTQVLNYGNGQTYPIGLKFTFNDVPYDETTTYYDLLKKEIVGFFIVRQKRVPTIFAQGMAIGLTGKEFGSLPVLQDANGKYVSESFIKRQKITVKTDSGNRQVDAQVLGSNVFPVNTENVVNKAMIVPEAEMRPQIYNELFTSSSYKLELFSEMTGNMQMRGTASYYLGYSARGTGNGRTDSSKLTIVNDGMRLTTDGDNYFAGRAGEAEEAWRVVDVNQDWTLVSGSGEGVQNDLLSKSTSLVRGAYGTYVGSSANLEYGSVYNIRTDDYNSENSTYLENQYELRSHDYSAYYAVSERLSLEDLEASKMAVTCYRGDCYVCEFTHRLNRNFVDPDLPLNDNIVDPLTWNNNFVVMQRTGVSSQGKVFNEICDMFYRKWSMTDPGETSGDIEWGTNTSSFWADPDTFKEAPSIGDAMKDDITGKDTWKAFGRAKIQRSDVNAVPLGMWVSFKVLSNVNLSMRDCDYHWPTEQAIFNRPRGFYPYYAMNRYSNGKQQESNIINGGANVTLSLRHNVIMPDVPFIKNKFDTRILYSDIAVTDAFRNGFRIFRGQNYRDYPKTYGALTKLVEYNGALIAVMEHGVMIIPVNERAVAAQATGGTVYINTSNVLPENPHVCSQNFGSIWADSVIQSEHFVYGVDTVAKKIWRTNGQTLEVISDFKVQKFLNDNLTFRVTDKQAEVGVKNCKTHYNHFKKDVIFTFYNGDGKQWSLCWNETMSEFMTFYSWCPVFSENIDNIYFTFDRNGYSNEALPAEDKDRYIPYLWKHGQAGVYEGQEPILPTHWYNKVHLFEYEFVVNAPTQIQKIFNNLRIISNKTAPMEFEYEVVGETYQWYRYKEIIEWLNERVDDGTFADLDAAYTELLTHSIGEMRALYQMFPGEGFKDDYQFTKLPYLKRVRDRKRIGGEDDFKWTDNSTDVLLVRDTLLHEDRIRTRQYGRDIKKEGRVRGNMEYLEDLWDIEIRPTSFREAYLDEQGTLKTRLLEQQRIRDKYVKIRVRYSGDLLAVIQGLQTLYLYSYA